MVRVPLDVSVVICAYTEDRWDELVEAIKSAQQQSVPARQVIAVIDHNQKLLQRAISNIPSITAIENREQQGVSGARNSGIAASTGSIVAFLDDDAVASPDWLEQLLRWYANPNVIGVGGSIEPLWENGRPLWFPDEFTWVVGCTYRGLPKTAAPVRNLIGANMSFRRDVFRLVGYFHNGVGRVGTSMLHCDDTEFCIRAAQRLPGQFFLYAPQAKVHHRVPASRARWSYFRTRCYTEGLAKAQILGLIGSRDGLASERSYTLRTLPRGFFQGLTSTLFGRDRMGIVRAGAIASGLAITTAGYLVGISKQLAGLRRSRLAQKA